MSDLVIPKERSGGRYEVTFLISAFNPVSREAMIFCRLEKVKQSVVERVLNERGAGDVTVTTFSPKDYATHAAKALRSVLTKISTPGFLSFRRGDLPSYIWGELTQTTDGVPSCALKDSETELEESENTIARHDAETQVKIFGFCFLSSISSKLMFTGAKKPRT